ncbi:alanine racemase [Microbacterium sp. ET2]|uniref:alanine racemase n=1 Tax=Microbacterium albipurpureum TaxID=3050384 RepID=UPI00259CD49E|nr:alanine racemase [Microbacterium sp. ET2 (Ac-2212)]WJL95516.1 alanine racemase [Microbacterium sp. ET2 (Ac-2212)]
MSGSVLEVDLDLLARNLARVRAAIAPAELMLVVKNDAYGHGVEAVVARARREGVRWFGGFDVATGARVREVAGEGARIFVWIADTPEQVSAAIELDLDIGVGDRRLLDDVAARRGGPRAARVHLKIDTGLRRNGVRPEEWPEFVELAAAAERAGSLVVEGIWSHIAEASDEDDDIARARFGQAVRTAETAGLRPRWRHLAASAAAFARPEFRYDIARVGAFCFGIRPAGGPGEAELGVRPIARWEAPVLEVAGDVVRIGVGARDGLFSSLASHARIATPGGARRLLAVAGATSDVAAWPGAGVGDRVIVYGDAARDEETATSLAEMIGSIGEEVAVRVSPLVPRRYRGLR